MGEKKRKRHGEEAHDTSRKRTALEKPQKTIQVSVIEGDDDWNPILASAPGFDLPCGIAFNQYTRAQNHPSRPSTSGKELLLHSSIHPKLDYTAREERFNDSDNHLKHYIGVYDPKTGELQVVQVRKAVVRSTLRSDYIRDSNGKNGQKSDEKPSTLSARSNLGLAFGTKKSQKAIRALTANAIQPSPSKSNVEQSPEKQRQLEPLALAVVSSMADATSSIPTREQLQAEIDESKPVPRPNLAASTPGEVYPLEQLVGGTNTLVNMGVKDWIDKVKAGEDVQTKSRFVATRLAATVQGGDVRKLKAMRYLLLLIEWFLTLKIGPKSTKKVPKPEELAPLDEVYGREVVNGISKRFADGHQLNKWHLDNLLTHILALAISLDNFTSDTHDIREDLKLEIKDITRYYAELGCSTAAPSDAQRSGLRISKVEGQTHRIATLRLPLVFPKMRVPVSGPKRR